MKRILMSMVLVLTAAGALMAQDMDPIHAHVPLDWHPESNLTPAGECGVRMIVSNLSTVWILRPIYHDAEVLALAAFAAQQQPEFAGVADHD